MGTNFFKSGGFGLQNAGKVGTFVQPVAKYLKFASPGAGMADQMANRARRDNYVGSTPTPFAGKQPTLADANMGYVQAARAIAPQQPNVQIPQQPPRAWMG